MSFIKRLEVELQELKEKEQGLSQFLNTKTFLDVSSIQQILLKQQLHYMRGYIGILEIRLEDLTK